MTFSEQPNNFLVPHTLLLKYSWGIINMGNFRKKIDKKVEIDLIFNVNVNSPNKYYIKDQRGHNSM